MPLDRRTVLDSKEYFLGKVDTRTSTSSCQICPPFIVVTVDFFVEIVFIESHCGREDGNNFPVSWVVLIFSRACC